MSGGSDVFARAAFIKVKPECKVELTRTFEQEVIPLFRNEKDFRGLLAFTFPNGTKALSLSLWDQKKSTGGFCAKGVGALAALAKVALGTPSVQVYEVSNSAFHTMGEITDQGDGVESPPDLRIFQSALRLFKVSPALQTRGRGFPLVRGLINTFHK
jgi:hypothetical protein